MSTPLLPRPKVGTSPLALGHVNRWGMARAFVQILTITLLALASFGDSAKAAEEASVAIYAPYWRLGQGFETMIGVNNTRPKSITVTPRVYASSGEEMPSTPFTIGPMAAKTFPLRELLADQKAEGTGHVELLLSGSLVDVAAQLIIEEEAQHRLWNHVFEPKHRHLSSRYEGVFVGVADFEGARLALTNVTSKTMVASFSFVDGAGKIGGAVELAAHSQRVIRLSDYLARSQAVGRRAVGITVSHSGEPGEVIAHGLGTVAGIGSYNIRLVDAARLKSSSLISPALVLPWAHTAFLCVRNMGGGRSTISLIAHYSSSAAKKPQEVPLQQLSLEGNISAVVDLRDSLALLPTDAEDVGLEMAAFNAQGQPLAGQTVADLLLIADEGHQVIQTSPRDPDGEAFAAFSQPWDISGIDKTVIALTNPSKTERIEIMASLHYEGGVYSYAGLAEIGPGETRHISVNDLRDLQVPGLMNEKLPHTVTRGQAIVSAMGDPVTHPVLLAQSIIADPTKEASLSSSCSTCPPNANGYSVNSQQRFRRSRGPDHPYANMLT